MLGRFRTIGMRAASRFNSSHAQPEAKSMEKEVSVSMNIKFLRIGIRNISGNGSDTAFDEPAEGDTLLPRVRITAHPVVVNSIIIGRRRTNDLGLRVGLRWRGRDIPAAPIQHDEGKDRDGKVSGGSSQLQPDPQ
jgi:hypothetical protein